MAYTRALRRALGPLVLAVLSPAAVAGVVGCKKELSEANDIALAQSTSTLAPPTAQEIGSNVVVYTEPEGLRSDGVTLAPLAERQNGPASATVLGLPASVRKDGERSALVIVPLQEHIQKRWKGTRGVIALDGRTPYRVVSEIGYTLLQAGVTPLEFLAQNGGRRSLVRIEPRKANEQACADEKWVGTPEERAAAYAAREERMRSLAEDSFGSHREPMIVTSAPNAPPPPPVPQPLAARQTLCLKVTIYATRTDVWANHDRLDRNCDRFGPVM